MNLPSLALGQDRTRFLPHLAAVLELTKPKIAVLELLTVWVAACVACSGIPGNWVLIVNALIGTALVAASASTLNQWLERSSDTQMLRTADRPLPSGEVSDREALSIGLITMVLGTVYLAVLVHWITAVLGLVTWVLYVCIYTPLKKRTSANTLVGAIAGALPVLMGASAVLSDGSTRGGLLLAAILFGIVFFWQFPHFMAIAWIYREDYRRGRIQNAHGDRTDWSCRWITGSDIVCYPVTVKCASGSHDEGGAILFLSRNDAFVASIGGCHRFSVPSHGSVCTKNAPDVAHLLTCRLWNAMAESLYFSLVIILLI